MCKQFQRPVHSPFRMPEGLLGREYLKFLQISVDARFLQSHEFDRDALGDAMQAVSLGQMRQARPAMKIFFDGCSFWLASHFHRYEAARRLGARNQEFWCEIVPGSRQVAAAHAEVARPKR